MNKKTQYRILAGVGAGLIIVPLARYIVRRMKAAREKSEEGTPVVNHLFSAYRGKHKPHHRKAANNSDSVH